MTTLYPIRCPILLRCLRQLRVMVDGLAFDDERAQVDDLTQRLPLVSEQHEYICLRGFLVVEKMLLLLDNVYARKYRALDIQLPISLTSRSWGGLGTLKHLLEGLLDQVGIEVGELQLGGTKFKDNQLVQMGTNLYGATHKDSVMAASRAQGAVQLQGLLQTTIQSIEVLRPYLRNESVLVGTLGDKLTFMTKEVYGATATRPFIEMTRELMDVRL